MKMIFELFIKQKTLHNFVSFLTEQTLFSILKSSSFFEWIINRNAGEYVSRKPISFYMASAGLIKLGLSEKCTKFEKIFHMVVLTNQLIYLISVKTMRKIFSTDVCISKSPLHIDQKVSKKA